MSKRLKREDMPDQLILPSTISKEPSKTTNKSELNSLRGSTLSSASTVSAVLDRDPVVSKDAPKPAPTNKRSISLRGLSTKLPQNTLINQLPGHLPVGHADTTSTSSRIRKTRPIHSPANSTHVSAIHPDEDGGNRQAELFYLQKQIQQQTPMVFILEDGSRIQGVIEWYDRHSIKVRGKSRVLIYKSSIKYLYKAGEIGSAPDKY